MARTNNNNFFQESVQTNYDLYVKEVERKKKLVEGWEKNTPLLKNIKEEKKEYMAQLLENARTNIANFGAKASLNENGMITEGTSSGSVDAWTGVTLPLVRRVFNQLSANELVNVQALQAPSGYFFYINPTWNDNVYSADGTTTLYTAGDSIYGNPYDNDDFNNRFPFASMLNNYSRNQQRVTIDTSKNAGVVYSHVTDEDLRWQMSPTATTTFTIVDSATPAVDQEVALTYHLIKMKLYLDTAQLADGTSLADLNIDKGAISGTTVYSTDIDELYMDYTAFGTDDTGDYIQYIFKPTVVSPTGSTTGADLTIGKIAGNTVPTGTQANNKATTTLKAITTTVDPVLVYSTTSFESGNDTLRTYEAGVSSSNGNSTGTDAGQTPYNVFAPKPLPREINIKIERDEVKTESRRLKMLYTQESVDDVKAYHSLDLQKEVINSASEVITLEIDREIIEMLINTASANKYINFWSITQGMEYDKENSTFVRTAFLGTQQDWYQTLIQVINMTSKEIGRRAGRNDATFIVASPETCAILESIPGYSFSTIDASQKGNAGFVNQGSLKNKWEVYQYNYMRNNVILLGFRGTDKDLSAGAYFCPYIPLQFTPNMTDQNTMANIIGARTRYGKKVIRPEFYALIWLARPSLVAVSSAS